MTRAGSRTTGRNPRARGTNPRALARAARLAALPYPLYLRTLHWRTLRLEVLERWGGYCEGCGLEPATEVHHKTYERLGREQLDDLSPLCGNCHQAEHHPSTSSSLASVALGHRVRRNGHA